MLRSTLRFTRRAASAMLRPVRGELDWLKTRWLSPPVVRGDWTWTPVRPSPERRLDAVSATVGDRLYVFCGFLGGDRVLSVCDVLDLRRLRWVARLQTPPDMAQSHLGIATDGARTIYLVTGQLGPQCAPAVPTVYALDTRTDRWFALPPLPEARYAPAVQVWNGRLHVIGGSGPDRVTPTTTHWSLAVREGQALETAWRDEVPVPRGACHRPALVIGEALYVIGGQQGDYAPIPGDPDCTCTGETQETYCPDVLRLAPGASAWEQRADMPIAASHIESAFVQRGHEVLVFGGQIHKDPDTFTLSLTDAIQHYDASADRWTLVGALPYRVKNLVVGSTQDRVVVATGQRDRGPGDPTPGRIIADAWRAPLPAAYR